MYMCVCVHVDLFRSYDTFMNGVCRTYLYAATQVFLPLQMLHVHGSPAPDEESFARKQHV